MGARGPIGNKRRRAAAAATAGGVKVRQLPDDVTAMFKRVVKDLPAASAIDAALVEQFCQAAWLQRAAFQELVAAGLTVLDTTHGNGEELRRHPLTITWRGAAAELRAVAVQLGASPMARARMPEPEHEQLSLAEELFGMVEHANSTE